jgi:hypothetical protein
MPISMYESSVPVFQRVLTALSGVVDKAVAHAEARKIDPAVLVAARLYPDMFPFARQVQTATDHAKGASARLAAVEIPRFADTEATFAELKMRIEQTLDFIGGLDRGKFVGSDDRDVTLLVGGKERSMRGDRYLLHFAMPNFYFHVTTAYDILRHNGVEIGKRDFIGMTPQGT